MTDQYYFETEEVRRPLGHPRRARALFVKRKAMDESRRQAQINAVRRKALQTRVAIAELERTVLKLDFAIAAELERARVHDPSHFAYPISVRSMITRRDNVKATIAALTEQLARID
jgi:hypothetical protein